MNSKMKEEIAIAFYSLFNCWPRKKDEEKTKHKSTKSGKRISEEIKVRLIKLIKREVNKHTSRSKCYDIFFDKKNDICNEIDSSRSSKDISTWKKFSVKLAKNYSELGTATNAVLIICIFTLKGVNHFIVLRYNLSKQMRLGEEDLEILDDILKENCSKSAIYPSIQSIKIPKANDNVMKIFQDNDSIYFPSFLGLETKSMYLERQIEKEIGKIYNESLEKKEPLTITRFRDKLLEIIEKKEIECRRDDAKRNVTITIGKISIKTPISEINRSLKIQKFNGSYRIIIEDLEANVRFSEKIFEIHE